MEAWMDMEVLIANGFPIFVVAFLLLAVVLVFGGVKTVPQGMEFTTEPLRDDAGKVRRKQLRMERLPSEV